MGGLVALNQLDGMRTSVFIATSLDGFIARQDGAIDWLPGGDAGDGDESAPEEDHGYTEFFNSVDALVMGRNTFELVLTIGEWPYGSKRVFVLTSRALEIPESMRPMVEVLSGSPAEIVSTLAARGIGHIYLDGGKTIQRFIADGLVQRMIITRVPVLIGRGIPLFGEVPHDVRLRHVATRAYASGLVQSEYRIMHVGDTR
jgi:dihydrofolate reductase